MAFTDRVTINVAGGHGGGGCVSFRRESRTPRGGPDGGNGGRGGSVFIIADPTVEDLSQFRQAVHHKARPGMPGEGARKHGKAGADVEVHVPVGTRVIRDGEMIARLDAAGVREEVARGGEGGVGNYAFRSSTHQAPRESVPGMPGDETWLTLEFRLPVDFAIVGLPNSGKSSLLRALTGAAVTIAAYPWSTKEPALGPLDDDAGNLIIGVDLPGVDEHGAARPDGRLGHLERARVILHCVDGASEEPVGPRLAAARATVAEYANPDAREIVVATHCDPADRPEGAEFAVDCETGAGVDDLRDHLLRLLGA